MKNKNLISTLILTTAFSMNSIKTEAAVSLNAKGVGQVLIYPYYTVNNNINTLISLTNTTDNVKAVKIKFLEGKNNRDTLIFNAYIAPHDVWTAALVPALSTIQSHTGEESVKLVANDSSCTVPMGISGQEFLPFAFEGSFDDGFTTNLSRVTEGQIQVFDMGNVVGEFADWAMQSNNTQDCSSLQNNWTSNGIWTNNPTENITAPNGSGGLFGSVTLIDVNAGIDIAYNAEAIEGYSTAIQHESPASALPNLNSGNSNISSITTALNTNSVPWEFPFQAISSLFMSREIYSEYIVGNGIGANTEMIVSFPTKEFFTDPSKSPLQTPLVPFTSNIGECEPAELLSYDRETSNSTNSLELCMAVNTIEFITGGNMNGPSTILGSNNTVRVDTSFDKGWANLVFNQTVPTSDTTQISLNTYFFTGMPITGFTIQKYVNSELSGGILANYAGLVKHKGTTEMIIVQ